jgi:antitoxin component of MazEF toxin-antitoxin module
MADKEQTRKIGEAIMVSTYPDVCKSPIAPVPYMIVSNFINSQNVATTVNATSDPTFTKVSWIQGVIGDEGGTGQGVVSGTHAGSGASWAQDWSHSVRAEGQNVVRNDDPCEMNGQSGRSNPNTKGKVVYPKSGQPNGGVDDQGKPTKDTNPGQQIKTTQYGYESKGDPNWDYNSNVLHIGTGNTPLVPGESAAITASAAKALDVKKGDQVKITFADGKTQIRRIVDTVSKKIKEERVDLYNPKTPENPAGLDKSLSDYANISKYTPP